MVGTIPGSYKITIVAIDKSIKVLNDFNKRLAAQQAPMKSLGKSWSKFSELSGLNKMKVGLGNLKNQIMSIGKVILGVVSSFGLLGGALSVGGAVALLRTFAAWGTELKNTSSRLGTTIEQLRNFRSAALLAGGSAQAMDSSIESLGQKAQDALAGRDSEALRLFQFYGIGIRKSGMIAKDGADLMGEAFDAVKRLHDAGASAATVNRAMGEFGISPDMYRFAIQGAAGLEKYNQMAKRYTSQNQEGVAAADNMREAQTKLSMAFETFGYNLATAVGPTITHLLTVWADWMKDSKGSKQIIGDLGSEVKRFGRWLDSLTIKDVNEALASLQLTIILVLAPFKILVKGVREINDLFGGPLTNNIRAVGALIGLYFSLRFISPIWYMVRAMWGLAEATTAAAAAQTALGTAAKGGLLSSGMAGILARTALLARAAPLLLTGQAGGEDRGFSQDKNDEFTRGRSGRRTILQSPEYIAQEAAAGRPTPVPPSYDTSSYDTSRYQPLLDAVGRSEGTARNVGGAYNATYGFGAYGNTKGMNLTGQTIEQIEQVQRNIHDDPNNRANTSAIGKYQFEQSTLKGLVRQLGLAQNTLFTPQVQDQLAIQDMKNRGSEEYRAGTSNRFESGMGKEWDSWQGGHHPNISPAEVAQLMSQFKNSQDQNQQATQAATEAARTAVDININHQNVPNSVSMSARTRGDDANLNIRSTAMPTSGVS